MTRYCSVSARRLLTVSGVGLLALCIAAPAFAVTPATLTILGGTLEISAPTATANLGTIVNTVAGGNINGQLGIVRVSDGRSPAAGSGWVASAISSAFTPTAGPTIAASHVSISAGTITKIGTATYTANDPMDLTGVCPVVTASGITGDNSATWNPTLTVAVPGGTASGTYTAIVTHSVL